MPSLHTPSGVFSDEISGVIFRTIGNIHSLFPRTTPFQTGVYHSLLSYLLFSECSQGASYLYLSV